MCICPLSGPCTAKAERSLLCMLRARALFVSCVYFVCCVIRVQSCRLADPRGVQSNGHPEQSPVVVDLSARVKPIQQFRSGALDA